MRTPDYASRAGRPRPINGTRYIERNFPASERRFGYKSCLKIR